ncbi:cytochrome c [Bordetella genomosp. 13]|uniref:cytochrome c n=1 Tax=Bordetella genomosp. 13 TaxID=463040 RepID=UPI0011A63044|nr:cytochrome c [Bordetella genomosp. 13]
MWKSKRQILNISCALLALAAGPLAAAADAPAPASQQKLLDGKYLSIAADCVACHTAKGGAPYAGGYAIESPMGQIWSTNITPSKRFGIGDYTEREFARALREGIARDGHHLYPAMPYTSYAQLTDKDVSALYAYFMNDVKPVEKATPRTDLPFPFSMRASMVGWNLVYNSVKPFTPDPSKPQEINRGNYLANALAHCAECHTPRTALMGPDTSLPLAGGPVGAWYALNITSDKTAGIGGWSDQELYQYLRTGHAEGRGQAAGPMAEAVENSLQFLSDGDLRAIVAYLKDTQPIKTDDAPARDSLGQPSDAETRMRGNMVQDANPGWKVYTATCATCHGARGEGTGSYPSLYRNSAVGAARPDNLVATILYGVHRKIEGQSDIEMPGFGPQASYTERLTDQQIADVSNYVLASFGQPGQKPVTAQDVATSRAGGPASPLLGIARIGVPAAAVVLLLIVILLIARHRRTHKKA